MTVTVTLRVEVDRQKWVDTYGPADDSAAGVRADVKSYIVRGVDSSAAAFEGAIIGADLVNR